MIRLTEWIESTKLNSTELLVAIVRESVLESYREKFTWLENPDFDNESVYVEINRF